MRISQEIAHRALPRTTYLLLLLSGFAALTHQLVWFRLLSLSIGMTSAATGAVLAAVFLGMALGSWCTTHLPLKLRGQLRPFVIAELLVAISALALLPLMLNLGQWLALLPEWGNQVWFRFTLVTLLLALPAAGLGAAYPLLASIPPAAADNEDDSLWRLYGIHTLGAVIGVLATSLFLIPNWGLDGALYCAAGLNLLAALLAFANEQEHRTIAQSINEQADVEHDGNYLGLVTLCITGLTATAVQIGWTKYLAIHTGSTLYGFSLILAIFLTGVSLGAWVGRRLASASNPANLLAYGLLSLGLFLVLARSGLGMLPLLDQQLVSLDLNLRLEQTLRYGTLLVTMLPVTLLFGALFPLSLRYYCGTNWRIRVGRGYAANTLAGIVGATAAGLWFIPRYGTDTLLWLMALLLSLSALLLLPRLTKARLALLFAVAVVTAIAWHMPGLNFQKLIASVDHRQLNSLASRYGVQPKFLFIKEGQSGVISLVDYDGIVVLKNDSLNEAHLAFKRARSEILLGLMPQLLKPNAKHVLVVGYGAGTTTKVLAAADVLKIRTIELEPAVIEAMTRYEGHLPEVLNSPSVQFEINDARNVLQIDPHQYDAILSQPSHTWRAGSGALFSQEYFQLVHRRLNKGGLFGMWLNLFQMDGITLRAIFKTFFTEFPKGVIFINNTSAELLLFGSDEPLELDYDYVRQQLAQPALKPYLHAINVATPDHILRNFYLFTSDEALAIAGDSRPVTDLNLLAEVRLAGISPNTPLADDPLQLIRPYVK